MTNGMVMIAGGQDINGNSLASVELYDPTAGTFSVTGKMNSTRLSLSATLLNNGQVLIAAGLDFCQNSQQRGTVPAELPCTTGIVSIALNPQNPSIAVGDSQQLVATGTFGDNSTETLQSVTWSSSNNTFATISNDASNYGNDSALSPGTVNLSASADSVCGLTTLTVAAPSPAIASLSPAFGPVGTSELITGTNSVTHKVVVRSLLMG